MLEVIGCIALLVIVYRLIVLGLRRRRYIEYVEDCQLYGVEPIGYGRFKRQERLFGAIKKVGR